MRRTRKRKALGDVAAVVAASLSLSDAARKLGVNVSTVSRWVAAGHAPKPGAVVAQDRERAAAAALPASDWAAQFRASRILDETQGELVGLAADHLALAKDGTAPAMTRLAASRRFSDLIRQLTASEQQMASQAQPVKPALARRGGDPRSILMVVK